MGYVVLWAKKEPHNILSGLTNRWEEENQSTYNIGRNSFSYGIKSL